MIARTLDGLPLALDQAGAYILETGCGLATYLVLYKQQQSRLLQRRGSISADHPQSVTTTFTLAFEEVRGRSEAAIELLRLCAFLAPDAIAEEIISGGAAHLGPILRPVASDAYALDEIIEILRTFSLIKRDPVEKILNIHRLVQVVLETSLEEQLMAVWIKRVTAALNTVFPSIDYPYWIQCERLMPHVFICANRAQSWERSDLDLASLLDKTGHYLYMRGHHGEARLFFQQASRIQEQVLGPDHPDLAFSLHGIATIYYDQGKYSAAEQLLQRVLRIREQALSFDHPDVAKTLGVLANIYEEQGKYSESEQLNQRALYIRERALGPDHPDVAMSLNNLANVYKDQAKYAEAKPLLERAIRIREQTQGPDHPDLAYPLTNLANVYEGQGKYIESEQLNQRALRIREQALGPDHHQVAYPLHNLGEIYRELEQYSRAEPFFQRALNIWEQTLGQEHPHVATTLHNYEQKVVLNNA